MTLMVTGGTRTVNDGTHMVNGGILTAADGIRMIDGSTIAGMTRLCHHQARQHPHVCWHKAKIQSCMQCMTELDSIKIIAHTKIRE
jgi:hypothetical protein